MDLERLEQFVLRCPLQELLFWDDSGVYVLGNEHARSAWWYVGYRPNGSFQDIWYEGRGLRQALEVIEQCHPKFSAWLLLMFSENGVDK